MRAISSLQEKDSAERDTTDHIADNLGHLAEIVEFDLNAASSCCVESRSDESTVESMLCSDENCLAEKGTSAAHKYENNPEHLPCSNIEESYAHSNEFRIGRRSIMLLLHSRAIMRRSA